MGKRELTTVIKSGAGNLGFMPWGFHVSVLFSYQNVYRVIQPIPFNFYFVSDSLK